MLNRIVLGFLAVLFIGSPALGQLQGSDTTAGSSCASYPEGTSRFTASPSGDGSSVVLICDGSVWQKAGGGLSALQGSNDTGPCTSEKDGLIKYNPVANPKWQYCDGGSTSWLPFKLPQCADDDTGECTLAALRTSSDPQFKAASIRCGDKILGVTGTYGSGSSAAFTWTDVSNATPSTLTATGTVSISGIAAGCPAEVEVSGQGSPQVSVNGGAWGSGGAITNGQTLAVRLTSSGTFGVTNTANVLIGSTADAWSVTTRAANNCTAQSKTWLTNCTASVSAANHGSNGTASISDPGGCGTAYYGSGTFACSDGSFTYSSGTCTQQTACDTTPNSFTFADISDAELSTLTTATAITISGINTSTPVSVTGTGNPQVSIDGGSWVSSGSITNGQTLAVRLTSSASGNTAATATVIVGGESVLWSVTTVDVAVCGALATPVGASSDFGKSITIYNDMVAVSDPKTSKNCSDCGDITIFDYHSKDVIFSGFYGENSDDDSMGKYGMAINGNNLIVGNTHDGDYRYGRVYLFNISTGERKIYKSGGSADELGNSVAIDGNFAVVGYGHRSKALVFNIPSFTVHRTITGPTANASYVDLQGEEAIISFTDLAASPSGVARLYNVNTGALLTTFNNPTPAANDNFGRAVAISGDKVVVSAIGDDTAGTDAGALYVFNKDSGSLLHTILNPNPAVKYFGNTRTVRFDGDAIWASQDGAAVGGVLGAGTLYAFSATTGALIDQIDNPSPYANEKFGSVFSVAGNQLGYLVNEYDASSGLQKPTVYWGDGCPE